MSSSTDVPSTETNSTGAPAASTTAAPSAPPSTPSSAPTAPPRRGIPGSHYMLFLLLIAAGVAILFLAGAFRRTPRIAIVTAGDTPYWDLVIAGAKEAASAYDVELTVIKSKTDAQAQTDGIRQLLNQKFDGIGVSPVNPSAQAGVLYDVAAVTTLVTLDSDSPVSKRLCYVGTDNYAAGRLCGQYVRRALPEGGEVIVSIGNLEREGAQHRRQGLIDELLDRPFEPEHPMDAADATLAGSQYKVVATLVDGADPQVASDLATKAISEHPSVKLFVGMNGYTTPALLRALDGAKKTGQIKLVGFDASKDTLAGIESGNVYATVVQDQFGCGYHTVRILAENARGNHSGLPMFQRRTLPVEVITKDNLPDAKGQLSTPTTKPT